MAALSTREKPPIRRAILLSGGLDSAVLVASELEETRHLYGKNAYIQPIYVTSGFSWESGEQAQVNRLLQSKQFHGLVRQLACLDCPVSDTYPSKHWSLNSNPPAYNTPDEDVYLVGRNILLLAKVSAYCAINRIERIAIGPLAGNPFPDATPEFFRSMQQALSQGLNHDLEIVAPFSRLSKADVIKRGQLLRVPFELTVSCMKPLKTAHCGRCSKCRERLLAFQHAGISDPASYDFTPHDIVHGD